MRTLCAAMKLDDGDIGMFLGGLLTVLVRNRAHELAGEMSDEDWNANRGELLEAAFEDIVVCFPEPLRHRLRGSRDEFLAGVMSLN